MNNLKRFIRENRIPISILLGSVIISLTLLFAVSEFRIMITQLGTDIFMSR